MPNFCIACWSVLQRERDIRTGSLKPQIITGVGVSRLTCLEQKVDPKRNLERCHLRNQHPLHLHLITIQMMIARSNLVQNLELPLLYLTRRLQTRSSCVLHPLRTLWDRLAIGWIRRYTYLQKRSTHTTGTLEARCHKLEKSYAYVVRFRLVEILKSVSDIWSDRIKGSVGPDKV
jgi:hypothetical protein